MILALVVLSACGNKKDVTNSEAKASVSVEEVELDSEVKKVIVEQGYERITDVITIKDARIKGTQLHLDVQYPGGCGDHTFELFTDGFVMKSLPPKQVFFLRHYAHDDLCKGLVNTTVAFELEGVASEGNNLVLLLEGFKGDLKMEF